MASRRPCLSEFRSMWLFAIFDLPVLTSAQRRSAAHFRHLLLKQGFMMLQYSVYARFLASEEAAESHRRVLRRGIPSDGEVRLMAVTDHQFGKMEV